MEYRTIKNDGNSHDVKTFYCLDDVDRYFKEVEEKEPTRRIVGYVESFRNIVIIGWSLWRSDVPRFDITSTNQSTREDIIKQLRWLKKMSNFSVDYTLTISELLQDLYDSTDVAWDYAYDDSYHETLDTISDISEKIVELAARLGISIKVGDEEDDD